MFPTIIRLVSDSVLTFRSALRCDADADDDEDDFFGLKSAFHIRYVHVHRTEGYARYDEVHA